MNGSKRIINYYMTPVLEAQMAHILTIRLDVPKPIGNILF